MFLFKSCYLLIMISWSGNLVAVSSDDGILIWDSSSRKTKPHVISASTLGNACSCVAWSPNLGSHKRKKGPGSDKQSVSHDTELLGIGTTGGAILIYSTSRSEMITKLEGAHTSPVCCMVFTKINSIISADKDGLIAQWDLAKCVIKRSWRCDKRGDTVSCLALDASERYLLSASRKIKCWDLDDLKCVQTFSGHATPITSMFIVEKTPSSNKESFYFITSAENDRMIVAWQVTVPSRTNTGDPVGKVKKVKQGVAQFLCTDAPEHVSVFKMVASEEKQAMQMCVCTNNGSLEIFRQHLNGHCGQPVSPIMSCSVASTAIPPRRLPVLAANFVPSGSQVPDQIRFFYGRSLAPLFETITVEEHKDEVILVRDEFRNTNTEDVEGLSKTKTPVIGKDVAYLTAADGGVLPTETVKSTTTKRKAESDITMEERLEAMTTVPGYGKSLKQRSESPAPSSPEEPSSDTLAMLLSQGLHSGDKEILDHVLTQTNDAVIIATVEQLPLVTVVPLVKAIAERIQSKITLTSYTKWLKTTLTVHMSYLSSHPEIVEVVNSKGLYQMMNTRLKLMDKVFRLQGRLNLLVQQADMKEKVFRFAQQKPQMVFDEGASDSDIEDEDEADEDDELDAISDMTSESDGDEQGNDGDQIAAEDSDDSVTRRRLGNKVDSTDDDETDEADEDDDQDEVEADDDDDDESDGTGDEAEADLFGGRGEGSSSGVAVEDFFDDEAMEGEDSGDHNEYDDVPSDHGGHSMAFEGGSFQTKTKPSSTPSHGSKSPKKNSIKRQAKPEDASPTSPATDGENTPRRRYRTRSSQESTEEHMDLG